MKHGAFTKVKLGDIGEVWVAATEIGLCRLKFKKGRAQFFHSLPKDIEWSECDKSLKDIVAKLKNFAEGKKVRFDLNFDLRMGTPFQNKVWQKIAAIPWGETRSYAELAHAIGRPKAFRAVANACGANPIPIIIPCHRVIASSGAIGGFSSGISIKKKLLKLEGSLSR